MKLIKKYFLYVANAPIWNGIITGMILFVLMIVLITAFFFNSGWTALNLSADALTFSAYFTLTLSAINFIVVKLFITSFTHLDKKIIVINNGEKIEKYQKPIWGNYPYCIIDLPRNWKTPLSKRVNSIEIESKIRVNKLISRLKFQIFFSFTEELSENELNTLIKSQVNYRVTHHVNFAECIKSLFENNNQEAGNNAVIEIIISDWLDSPRDRNDLNDLIEKINGIIDFPNDLFDNMKIEVLLEKVEIQLACVLG